MHRDPRLLGSVILFRIIPKERTFDQHERKNRRKSSFSLYCSTKQLKCNLRIIAFAPTKSPFRLLRFPFRRSLEAAFLVSRVTTSRLPQRRMMWRRRPSKAYGSSLMHVQYSLSETTRIHDLSTRKMHLIR